MTTAAPTPASFATAQHLVLEDISWAFYEEVLREFEERPAFRIAYDEGRLEIMSPLPKHEVLGSLLARLLGVLCLERGIDMVGLGSTTFRSEVKRKGLEPDECFYVGEDAAAGRELDERFDPLVNRPPSLAVEVDITRKSVPRQPIYAALGVPEIWRVQVGAVQCLHLVADGHYAERPMSLAFPFLRPADLWPWMVRLRDESSVVVLREFQGWARAL